MARGMFLDALLAEILRPQGQLALDLLVDKAETQMPPSLAIDSRACR